MNKTKLKEFIVACHRLVTNNPDRYESWEWENKFIDGLTLVMNDVRKKDLKKFFFLLGVKHYISGKADLIILFGHWFNNDYRDGLRVASELCEEIKYFGEAFGKDSYSLKILERCKYYGVEFALEV